MLRHASRARSKVKRPAIMTQAGFGQGVYDLHAFIETTGSNAGKLKAAYIVTLAPGTATGARTGGSRQPQSAWQWQALPRLSNLVADSPTALLCRWGRLRQTRLVHGLIGFQYCCFFPSSCHPEVFLPSAIYRST